MRLMKTTCAGALAATLVAVVACSRQNENDSLRDGLAGVGGDVASADTVRRRPPADATEVSLPDTAGLPSATAAPSAPQDTQRLRPGEPRDARPWIPERLALPATPSGDWSAGTREKRGGGGSATLVGVRVARNEGFDRIVFQFAGDRLPGYHVEYVDRPVRQCGSGDPVPLAGQGALLVRLEPAQAHDDRGAVTLQTRALQTQLPVLREARLVCDFEGQVAWALGVTAPNPFRVLTLSAPARVVVDVGH